MPSKRELREAARSHVLWEMGVFRAAVESRLDATQWRHHRLRYSIFTDSLLIHARSLHEFFTRSQPRWKSDVLATDLVDGWSPPEFEALDATCIEDISKFRGHMTLDRNTRDRRWNDAVVEGIGLDIEKAWKAFTNLIPPEERELWQI